MTFQDKVQAELNRARRKHPTPLNSEPEAWAVIQEELDEFRDAYRARHRDSVAPVIKELIETAAMCQRTYEDLFGELKDTQLAPLFPEGPS